MDIFLVFYFPVPHYARSCCRQDFSFVLTSLHNPSHFVWIRHLSYSVIQASAYPPSPVQNSSNIPRNAFQKMPFCKITQQQKIVKTEKQTLIPHRDHGWALEIYPTRRDLRPHYKTAGSDQIWRLFPIMQSPQVNWQCRKKCEKLVQRIITNVWAPTANMVNFS